MPRTHGPGDAQELTVAEVEQLYPDEWALLEITRDHKRPEWARGRLIAHSPDRGQLDGAYADYRAAHPSAHLYEFFTGELVAPGVVAAL